MVPTPISEKAAGASTLFSVVLNRDNNGAYLLVICPFLTQSDDV